jgi:hypothetical protein
MLHCIAVTRRKTVLGRAAKRIQHGGGDENKQNSIHQAGMQKGETMNEAEAPVTRANSYLVQYSIT